MRRMIIGVLTVVVLTLAIVAVHQIAQAQPAAQPAGVGTFYKTYRGIDFQALDSNDVVYWASGTGGGVWVSDTTRSGASYLEVRVDLPSGAQVTEVTFYVRNCEVGGLRPSLYLGAYGPATSAYTALIPEFLAPTGACITTQSLVQPLSPPITIDNAQSAYVIGYKPSLIYPSDSYNADIVKSLLVGARVTYQMPGAFLPLVQR